MHWGSLPIRKETTNYSIHFYIYTAMANHKIYYLLLFFLLPFSFLGAQNGVADQLLKATFHPSPQSAAYARYGEYPVDHSTGVPKIEIPIYTLNTGDYELPISISYHASGIKVLDVSGPVGLGWTLNAGGVITRTVCGAPDFEGFNYRMFFKSKADVEKRLSESAMEPRLWNRVFAGVPEYDSESDRYSYNFAGKAGMFRYNVYNETPFTIPHEPIKIERTSKGYKVIDTDGTTYYFEAKESCRSPQMNIYTSAWYLTKIETAGRKNVITLSYTPGDSYIIRYRSQFLHKGNVVTYSEGMGQDYVANETTGNFGGDVSMPIYLYQVPMLSSISWNNVNITFSYAKDRLDTQKERLTSITVKDNNSTVKHVTFNNNAYFGNHSSNYRMKLGSLSMKGNTTNTIADNYTFSYDTSTPPDHYNASNAGAPANSYCREDYWGYYNGTQNYNMIPDGVFPASGLADRNASPLHMQMCMLKTIQYPTGGSTTFNFETNRTGAYSYIGGLRVAEIINKDHNGTILEQKTYEYGRGEATMEILNELFSYEDYFLYFIRQANGAYQCRGNLHQIAVASPILPLTGWSGSPVFYNEVTEYKGLRSANVGKTVYRFTQDFESSYPGAEEEDVPVPVPLRFYSGLYNNDEGLVPALLKEKTLYKNNNGTYVKQLSEEYEYTELVPPNDSISIGVRLGRLGIGVIYYENVLSSCAPYSSLDEFYNSIVYTNVRGYRKLRKLTSVKTTDYERNVVATRTYQYDPQLRCLQPITETTTNSDEDNYTTKTYYPFQQAGTVYSNMTAKNYVDTPIKKEKYCNSALLSTDLTTYQQVGDKFLPDNISQQKGNNVSRVLVRCERYDSKGNPQYLTTLDNRKIVILWGYNYRYPIARIEGLTYSEVTAKVSESTISSIASGTAPTQAQLDNIRSSLSNALVTTYTYAPSVGITTETAPNGYKKTYSYDVMGRLSQIADTNGTVETYQYQYKQ